MLAGAMTTVAYAWLAGPLLTAVHGRDTHVVTGGNGVMVVAATVLAVTVARAVAMYGRTVLTARVGQDVVRRIRARMYGHLLDTVPSVLLNRRAGEIASRLSNDALQVQALVASHLASVVADTLALAGLVVLAFRLDVVLALVALAALPPIAIIVWKVAGRVRRAHREVWAQHAELSAQAAELVDAVPIIRAYGAELLARASFDARARELERRALRAQRFGAAGNTAVQVLGGAALVSALMLSAVRLDAGDLAPETFVSFFAAMLFVYRPVQRLGTTVHQIASGLAALDRVEEVLALELERPDAPGALELHGMSHSLTLEGARFEYREGERVLDGIDLEVRAGETVALVGASGAGKTTLVRILLGLIRPQEGHVRIDGIDLDRVKRESWRRLVAWVPQEPLLFADTIVANVATADPSPDRARVREALRGAGALEFVDALPSGVDTVLSAGAKELSAGQRQRLCIARALYKDSPILIFDEATSSLDGPSERAVSETIESLLGQRTVILVSHQLRTVRRADRALVLENGRIVEAGPPDLLWKTASRFRALFEDERRGEL
jgi:ABC-type multidrug transport system fused ATPase/permease subunit